MQTVSFEIMKKQIPVHYRALSSLNSDIEMKFEPF